MVDTCKYFRKCFGSGLNLDSNGSANTDPDWEYGPRAAKIFTKKGKN
jgi:hypothetical protein